MNPIQIPHDAGRKLNILGIPMVIRIHGRDTGDVVGAVGFQRFFEGIGALSPQQQQDVPRVIEIEKKHGLEFPPPQGA